MQRSLQKFIILILAGTALLFGACRAAGLPSDLPLPTAAWAGTAEAVQPTPAPTAAPPTQAAPTLPAAPLDSPTVIPTTAPSAEPSGVPENYPQVIIHPEGGLYVGDQVSFEVLPRLRSERGQVQLRLDGPAQAHYPVPQTLDTQEFRPFGIGGRNQATFTWVWDTHNLPAGAYDLTFSILPDGQTWTQTLELQPASQLPAAEQGAAWALARSQCCAVYYITQTEAERDLPDLLQRLDAQAQDAVARMGVPFTEPITITLVPRLLGQGGFADDVISVSYLDRDYTAGEIERIIHHEMIHILDLRLGGDLRPSVLVEGLAVYESGGHFKSEPLMPRAAALLAEFSNPPIPGLDWYIPLRRLTDQFYTSQHEVGYLQGASLIEYMVRRWGWEAFSAFYRDIKPSPSNSQADAIDDALQRHFDLSFSELERDFKLALGAEPSSPEWRADVELTVQFYDTMRRYQRLLDPAAYFLNAWLPDQKAMRERNIVADYLRHPSGLINRTLETMLAGASRDLAAGRYAQMQTRLAAVNKVLDAVEDGSAEAAGENPINASPLAARYASLAEHIAGLGLDLQRLEIDPAGAAAWVREGLNGLREMKFVELAEGEWVQAP